ncbi:hypothetical protein U1Q18_038960 [Sarracenia purpurea var. burkii]
MPQPQPRQQLGLNDTQTLQRHIMLKQLQELRRHQQLQDLGDERQQNYLNHPSATNKQAALGQFLPLINGTLIHDASQMFMAGDMSLVQHSTSPAVQGFGLYSQARSPNLCSMGVVPQQLEMSLYGTPIASSRNNVNQYSHPLGLSDDSSIVLTRGSYDQTEKPTMKSSDLGNSFLGENCNVSSDLLCLPDGPFLSKEFFHGKNQFGKVPIHGFIRGFLPENIQQMNNLQRNASAQEFNGRQEQAGLLEKCPGKTTEINPSQGLTTLDPLEQKILFTLDDNDWNASFSRNDDLGAGGFENSSERVGHANSFPSIQSGSWSALMQSAVAEASSSDTGLQEEWSGLSFQNTEPSTDNQPSNFVDTGKQQTGWVDDNGQSASSLTCKPQLLFNDSNMSFDFPGFQQSGVQFSIERREAMRSDSSHGSVQQSPRVSAKWLECNSQRSQPIEESRPIQPSENAWADGNAYKQNISLYSNSHQPNNKLTGIKVESPLPSGNNTMNACDKENVVNKSWAGDEEKESDTCQWKIVKNCGVSSFSNSLDGMKQMQSGASNTMVGRDDPQWNIFAALPNPSTTKVDQETSQHVPECHQLDYTKHVDISVKNKGNENVSGDLHQSSNGSQVLAHFYKGASETIEKPQNHHHREKSSDDSYHSNASHPTFTEDEARKNMWQHASDSRRLAMGNQNLSGQVSFQEVSRESSSHEQGYFAQFKFVGDGSNSAVKLEKGRSFDGQRNSKGSEELLPTGNIVNVSASDRSVGIYGSNLTSLTSQNMLELLHKVDHTRGERIITHFSSTDSSPLLEVPDAEPPDASRYRSHDQSPVSQCFGLRLAPPSQQLPNSNSFSSLQSSPQSGYPTAASLKGHLYERNQFQRSCMPVETGATQSPQSTLPGMASRLPPFNSASSHDTSQPVSINSFGHQFPILEAMPVGQPSLTSEPTVLPSELLLPGDSTNTNLQTPPWARQEQHDQNSYRGTVSRESGASSMTSQGFENGEEHQWKKRSQQQIFSEIVDQVSHKGELFYGKEYVGKHLSDNAIGCGSLVAQHHRQNFDSAGHADKQAAAVSARDLEAFGRSLKPSFLHPIYSLLDQVPPANNVQTGPGRRVSEKNQQAVSNLNIPQVTALAEDQTMYGHNSSCKEPINSGLNMASQLNSFPTRDAKMLKFSSEAGDQSIEVSSLPVRQSYFQSDSGYVGFNRTEHTQISLQMAPSWFNHYGTLKNGEILPMYDARIGKNSSPHLPFWNPSENLHANSSIVHVNAADASQVTSVWPTTATALAVGKLPPACVLFSDGIDWNLSVENSKKRKNAFYDLLPWHKEVTQSSKRRQTLSATELEWAQAANRLIEKVVDDTEMIEDGRPLLRVKKRLVLSTQLMQQVFSLTSCLNSDSCLSSNGYDTMPEKSKPSERIGEQYFSKIVEDFIIRVKKLENDLFRLDETASIVDARVDYQELERFSIINQIVKFHSRVQPNAVETSSSIAPTPSPKPQRYVTAFPMPRVVPVGVQCLPL